MSWNIIYALDFSGYPNTLTFAIMSLIWKIIYLAIFHLARNSHLPAYIPVEYSIRQMFFLSVNLSGTAALGTKQAHECFVGALTVSIQSLWDVRPFIGRQQRETRTTKNDFPVIFIHVLKSDFLDIDNKQNLYGPNSRQIMFQFSSLLSRYH